MLPPRQSSCAYSLSFPRHFVFEPIGIMPPISSHTEHRSSCQERYRRGVAKRGMATFPVIERHDVDEQVSLSLGACTVARAVYPLTFQAIEEALGRRVVPAVTLATYRAGHAVCLQSRLIRVACILPSSLRVMNQTRRRHPAQPSHAQRIHDDVRRHPWLDRPANDFPVEQIELDGQIQPAFCRPDPGQTRPSRPGWEQPA